MKSFFERYLVPGLVIQAVLVGGGYATGRELVEFFLPKGPATGLLGIALTALLFSVGSMISFELARRFRAFDYRTFCKVYLGRAWWLFEIGYFASLLLVLSVVSAAAGKLLVEMIGSSELLNASLFMVVTAALVVFGNRFIERVISAWSLVFYITYIGLFVLVVRAFGGPMATAIASAPIDLGSALWNGISYTGYNIPLLPILIFVARDFRTRKEALIAGAMAGPLILAPGVSFLLALSAFYPAINSSPLPVTFVLDKLDYAFLGPLVKLVILGALVKTGAGLLHGLNERFAGALSERGGEMKWWVRAAIALTAMILAVGVAGRVGLVDLIGRGYRYSSLYFTAVFVIPLLTYGAWRAFREAPRPDEAPAGLSERP